MRITSKMLTNNITFAELTLANWKKFETLFGAKGACGGCWCMFWRCRAAEYNRDKGIGNRGRIYSLVKQDRTLGVLALRAGDAVGWCSISPRDELVRLQTSRTLKTIDKEAVWSITCFFIKREFRRRGISRKLIKAAVRVALAKGARIIEAYPIDTPAEKYPDTFAFTGFASVFKAEGFEEVARRSQTRPILRKFATSSGNSEVSENDI